VAAMRVDNPQGRGWASCATTAGQAPAPVATTRRERHGSASGQAELRRGCAAMVGTNDAQRGGLM
jgi:hypothetical protein